MAKAPKRETGGKPWEFVDHPQAGPEFDELPPDLQARLFDRLSAAAITGFNLLRMPVVRPVAGLTGVIEIREGGDSGEASAFYVSRPARRAVVVGYRHPVMDLSKRTLAKLARRAAEAR